MKTVIRTLIFLAIVVWLGGLLFFPIVAAESFTYSSTTHSAGEIVGACLRILHKEGLAAGGLLVILLIAASAVGVYPRRVLRAPMLLVVIMLLLTAISQYRIIPQMETYRVGGGGAIDAAPDSDPNRIAFNRLHGISEHVEEGVMLAGILLVIFIAAAESTSFRRRDI